MTAHAYKCKTLQCKCFSGFWSVTVTNRAMLAELENNVMHFSWSVFFFFSQGLLCMCVFFSRNVFMSGTLCSFECVCMCVCIYKIYINEFPVCLCRCPGVRPFAYSSVIGLPRVPLATAERVGRRWRYK